MTIPKKKQPVGFIKTTLLGALLVIVPTGIIGFALWEITALTRGLLGPVFEKLPFDSAVIKSCVIVASLLLVVLGCYFTGLLVRTRWGRRFRRWIESRFLERIPGYKMIRSLAHQYVGEEGEKHFRPVLVDLYGSGTKVIGFAVEELGDGTVAIFLPSVPAVTLGQLQIVPASRVSPLPATMHATIETLTMFGEGTSHLLGRAGSE
jgi:uncharacterized membrane protein